MASGKGSREKRRKKPTDDSCGWVGPIKSRNQANRSVYAAKGVLTTLGEDEGKEHAWGRMRFDFVSHRPPFPRLGCKAVLNAEWPEWSRIGSRNLKMCGPALRNSHAAHDKPVSQVSHSKFQILAEIETASRKEPDARSVVSSQDSIQLAPLTHSLAAVDCHRMFQIVTHRHGRNGVPMTRVIRLQSQSQPQSQIEARTTD